MLMYEFLSHYCFFTSLSLKHVSREKILFQRQQKSRWLGKYLVANRFLTKVKTARAKAVCVAGHLVRVLGSLWGYHKEFGDGNCKGVPEKVRFVSPCLSTPLGSQNILYTSRSSWQTLV